MGPLTRRIGLAAVLLGVAGGSTSCTVVKPIVGVIAAPAMILGGTGGVPFGCCCDDGRGVVAFFVVSSAIGAVAGLATGIVSDVRVLTGHASDPTANWFDPFAVNH